MDWPESSEVNVPSEARSERAREVPLPPQGDSRDYRNVLIGLEKHTQVFVFPVEEPLRWATMQLHRLLPSLMGFDRLFGTNLAQKPTPGPMKGLEPPTREP
jgi:hypothetical protein